MAKTVKKVDPKATFKSEIMSIVESALVAAGVTVTDGEKFGMTKGTLVVSGADFDLQLKPITPKAGVSRYEVPTEE